MPKFKNDPILVLILSICTCGIYLIYWNMKMAEVMNAVAGKEVIPSPIAIFAGCCYPVNAYFYYLIGNDCLYKLSERVGEEPKDNAALFTFLGLLIPMVAAMMVTISVATKTARVVVAMIRAVQIPEARV